jgi:predicted molibdopterin-dependent oxidoreductase YjgC
MECVVVQDLFLNETAKYAHVFLPGAPSSKRMAPSPTPSGASRACAGHAAAGRQGRLGGDAALAKALGYDALRAPEREIMDEIARLTPTFAGVSYDKLDRRQPAVALQRGHRPRLGTPPCTSTASCVARAASSSPSTCRPTRRSRAASRCC